MANIEEKVEELIKDKIENMGYSLYDVEYAKEGPNYYLRIFIDSERVLRKDRHLEQNIGKQVEAKLFKKDERGNKNYTGELKAFDTDTVTIETSEETKIERKNIAQLKTVYNWDD